MTAWLVLPQIRIHFFQDSYIFKFSHKVLDVYKIESGIAQDSNSLDLHVIISLR